MFKGTFFAKTLLMGTVALSLIGFSASRAFAQSGREELENEVEILIRTIENNYGPLRMKADAIGLDWRGTKASWRARAEAMKSTNDLYFLVADGLAQLNDAHVSVSLPSTLTWRLPLQFIRVGDQAFVGYVETKPMREAGCPVTLGDELVGVGGRKIAQAQSQSPLFNKDANAVTNRATFLLQLTRLNETTGIPLSLLPNRKATFDFASERGDFRCVVDYVVDGVGLINREIEVPVPDFNPSSRLAESNPFGLSPEQQARARAIERLVRKAHELFKTEVAVVEAQAPSIDEGEKLGQLMSIGANEPFFKLPANFKRISLPVFGAAIASNHLFAGTFEHNGKRVGFMRIPSYVPSVAYTMQFGLRYVISRLEASSDVLIIDQTNNPGGMVVYSDMIVKALTGGYDRSKHMRFAVRPTESFLRQFAEMIHGLESSKDESGLPPEKFAELLGHIKADYKRIHDAYQKRAFMSEPISLLSMSEMMEAMIDGMANVIPLRGLLEKAIGAQVFNPDVKYTKPVFMLINELDFSGGDATPANLQDYGRVTLVGVRTAGAGGSVENFRQRVSQDFSFSLTVSLMVRADGSYVENYGVMPDVPFELVQSDVREGYTKVLSRLLRTLGL